MQLDTVFCGVPCHRSWEPHFSILVPQAALRLHDKRSRIVSLLPGTTHLLMHSQVHSPLPSSLPNQPRPTRTVFSLLPSCGFSPSLLSACLQTDTPPLPSSLVTALKALLTDAGGGADLTPVLISSKRGLEPLEICRPHHSHQIILWFPNCCCRIWHYRICSTGFLIMPHSPFQSSEKIPTCVSCRLSSIFYTALGTLKKNELT